MMIKWITSGLNYFGYINNEFSPIGWKDAKNDVTKLLGIADRQAQNINSLLKSIQFTNLMENQRQLFTKGMLVPVRNELDETKRRQRLEEMQKRKAIRMLGEMDGRMYELATEMKTSLEASVNRRNLLYALEAVQLALSLFGGVFSFMGAKADKKKFGRFGAINSGVQTIFSYTQKMALRGSTPKRMCYSKYKEMKKFAEAMMKFKVYVPTYPMKTDFTALNSLAMTELLKAQTTEKKNNLLLGFKCLIDFVGYPGNKLETVIRNYFEYSFGRLNLIGLAIQHDLNIKKLQFQEQRIKITIQSLEEAVRESRYGSGSSRPAIQNARLLFKDRMIGIFRNVEKDVLDALYRKSVVFQFVSLWNPGLLDELKSVKTSQRKVVGDAFFSGNSYLHTLNNKLDNLACKLRNCMAQSSRHIITDNSYLWIFTPETHEKLFNGIKTTGSGMVTITKEGICHSPSECVNLRLKRLYIEVSGEGLFEHQNVIRVEVIHSGQNLFYLPPDGHTTATYVQTKSKLVHINVDKTRLSSTECKDGASYCIASLPGHRNVRDMCTLTARTPAEQLYGAEPCRSLFAEYTISLPKIGADHPSNSGTATKNSKLLDWTKVKKIKFFASIRAYKNYPTMAQCAHLRGCGLK